MKPPSTLSGRLECVIGVLIVLNTVVMAAETQYDGISLGQSVQYDNYHRTKEEAWPHAKTVFTVIDWLFGIVFTLEVFLKVAGLLTRVWWVGN